MSRTGIIYGVNGPVIYLKGDPGFKISEMVYVGKDNLVGEVIGLKKGMTTVQVFEETTGLRPGETVTGTGEPTAAEQQAEQTLVSSTTFLTVSSVHWKRLQNLPANIFPVVSV